MLQGEDGKRKPKFKLQFSCFGYNRKNSMLTCLHVFIVWTHYGHQGENLTSVCMCVWCVCNSIHLFCCKSCESLCVWEHCGLLAKEGNCI